MKRREFITLLGGAAAWPLGARAQQAGKKMLRVGTVSALQQSSPTGPLSCGAWLNSVIRKERLSSLI